MNWDNSFNFSDLITKFSSTNAAPAPKAAAAKPLVLHIGRLHLVGAGGRMAGISPVGAGMGCIGRGAGAA